MLKKIKNFIELSIGGCAGLFFATATISIGFLVLVILFSPIWLPLACLLKYLIS